MEKGSPAIHKPGSIPLQTNDGVIQGIRGKTLVGTLSRRLFVSLSRMEGALPPGLKAGALRQKLMKKNQSWGGRFSSGPAEIVAKYTDSQSYDRALYAQDIKASQAHAAMLAKQGILTPQEASLITDGLDRVRQEIEANTFQWKSELEDVHMNIEARLTELIGETGKKLHTARSRNDQVGLTFRLFVSDCLRGWQEKLLMLAEAFVQKADAQREAILPGLTHLQPAQPISLAHYLLSYAWMLRRDYMRIEDALKRVQTSPLGACALAGTTYPLDPYAVASSVGFPNVYDNSLDAVSDRDFVIEAHGCASLIMMHLSRFCEEVILFANPNFGYIRLPDAYSTGSSIMPQKKNPDVAELMRGKSGRVFGHLTAMLTMMKGLPLAYNRDMQEDKEGFLDTNTTVTSSLEVLTGMLRELIYVPERMKEACKRGYLNATELADYLVGKNVPFREAHHITGSCVAYAEKRGLGLEDLELNDLQVLSPLIEKDVYAVLDMRKAVERRENKGATGPKSVQNQIRDLSAWLRTQKA